MVIWRMFSLDRILPLGSITSMGTKVMPPGLFSLCFAKSGISGIALCPLSGVGFLAKQILQPAGLPRIVEEGCVRKSGPKWSPTLTVFPRY
ncbi:hypothetical protein D8674_030753 [Pyrus ussuriensis x Pyrus communis]|uniref:Uncharacterized protein n=1 Tax=Pyrus ussuriensis x Pyrus communis TaxID=2448454 RepID=A0A5N5EXQ5_9ROSA|nr:hypothetical protein D8674_030753 [Pyrus ussuriensis x Pyrus communis]